MTTTMSLIAKQTVGSSGAASITFSNIPQTFTDLKVCVSARTSVAGNTDAIALSINGSTANLSGRYVFYNGNTGSALNSGTAISGQEGGWINGNTSTTAAYSNIDIYIPNYTSTTLAKSFSIDSTQDNKATGTNSMYMGLWAEAWNPGTQAAITSLTFTPSASYSQHTTIYLYGISSSSIQNTSVPYASGGDVITTDGTYWYHAFKSSGSFTPLRILTTDILVVAGGGGGGALGGGGAGGLRLLSSQNLTSNTNYTCAIGAGGRARSGATGTGVPNVFGTSGSNSTISGSGFTTISATGGGVGGEESTSIEVLSGGSGGGACLGSGGLGNVGSYTPVEGYAGGVGNSLDQSAAGGGGGGAGAAGSNATVVAQSTAIGGAGGNGLTNSIINSMGSATSTGQLSSSNYYYAGGGSGGAYRFGTTSGAGTGSAGLGGGGVGGYAGTAATSATQNTGGGGGGDGYKTNGWLNDAGAGFGGSGIIIVRYPV